MSIVYGYEVKWLLSCSENHSPDAIEGSQTKKQNSR